MSSSELRVLIDAIIAPLRVLGHVWLMFPTSFVTALTTCWQQEGNKIRIPLKRLHSLGVVPRRLPRALLSLRRPLGTQAAPPRIRF